MKTTLLIALLAPLIGAAPTLADDQATKPASQKKEKTAPKTTTVELHVSGMSCHNCSDAVEDALAALKGVEVVSVDAKSNLAIVKVVPGTVSKDQMATAVEGTTDYVVEQTVSYNDLEYENDGSFSREGKPFTGEAIDFHKKTGRKSKSYQFKDGKLHGLIREWYEDGTMSGKKFYKAGKRHGLTEYWDEKGKLTAQKKYVDDEHVEEEAEK